MCTPCLSLPALIVFSISCRELVWGPSKEITARNPQERRVKASTVGHFRDRLVPGNALLVDFQNDGGVAITSLLDPIDLPGLKVRFSHEVKSTSNDQPSTKQIFER